LAISASKLGVLAAVIPSGLQPSIPITNTFLDFMLTSVSCFNFAVSFEEQDNMANTIIWVINFNFFTSQYLFYFKAANKKGGA
jgi:hypothetical protein